MSDYLDLDLDLEPRPGHFDALPVDDDAPDEPDDADDYDEDAAAERAWEARYRDGGGGLDAMHDQHLHDAGRGHLVR